MQLFDRSDPIKPESPSDAAKAAGSHAETIAETLYERLKADIRECIHKDELVSKVCGF